MMKRIGHFFYYIFDTTFSGLYYICLIFAKGFFFPFYLLFLLLNKLFPCKVFRGGVEFFQKRQEDPVAFLEIVLVFLLCVFLYTYLYVDKSEVRYVDDNILENKDNSKKKKTIASDKDTYGDNEINLYRRFGKMDINSVNISKLKKEYNNLVGWIMVDGTNVNYPIVQTDDNDYYLNHDIKGSLKGSGWIFMDYRNDTELNDGNTIIYGHNLLNKTAFGSLSNVFTESWFKKSNHYIVVKTETKQNIYQIFSSYYVEPEVYYLQTNFLDDNEHLEFLTTLKGRSDFDYGLDVNTQDKIITLSTCTDDNKGRKVVHAKLIS